MIERTALCVAAIAALLSGGCKKTTHDKVDSWLHTSSGPDKLRGALKDSSLDADLRAHAAQNLVRLGSTDMAFEVLEAVPEPSRTEIATKLAPRLWENARIDQPMAVPSTMQSTAKDALFRLRPLASAETRMQIDTYLIDWLTGGWYEGRAGTGVVPGAAIVRAIGAPAGSRMIAALDSVIARPANAKGTVKIGDTLLLGVAVCGTPESVGKLLELVTSGQLVKLDPTLPGRAIDALIIAYLRPEDFEPTAPAALAANADRLAALARDESRPPAVVQGAIDLLRAAGMPSCLRPLVGMISEPHANPRYRWIAAQRALDCGKLEALAPVLEALPVNADYAVADLEGTVWERATTLGPRSQVAKEARKFLSSNSWVARVSGAEMLARLAEPASATSDAAAIRALAGDATPARGWWGDQEGVPAAKRKAIPTVGALAADAAKRLEELAKPGQKKG
jgi:hypothetical protein